MSTTTATEVRERPIIFGAEMIRALLAGRKSMTRRVAKPQPRFVQQLRDGGFETSPDGGFDRGVEYIRCPYGGPGDRLWVREKFQVSTYCSGEYGGIGEIGYPIRDLSKRPTDETWVPQYAADGIDDGPWRSSIHMPRWASRITLEIDAVRVERLQDISHRDAVTEGWPGADALHNPKETDERCKDLTKGDWINATGDGDDACIEWFADLWESIHGPGSWERSPWVWVISFHRVEFPAPTAEGSAAH